MKRTLFGSRLRFVARPPLVLAVLTSVVIAASCNEENPKPEPPAPACTSGQQIACACPGGAQGVQVCVADGSAYGACEGCSSPSGAGGGAATGGGVAPPCEVAATRTCYGGPPGTEQLGTCKDGFQVCSESGWGECLGDVKPVTESCNGADDDCDGVVDDEFPCAKGGPAVDCATSCGTVGKAACSETCQLQDCVPPSELCDGIDQDCDGSVDNGLSIYGLATTLKGARAAHVAFSGSVYAVAYGEFQSNHWKALVQFYDVNGVPVGTPVDVAGVVGGVPDVAWNGAAFGLVWPDIYNGSGVYFRAYSEAGNAQTDAIKLSSNNNQSGIAITAIGSSFLIATDHFASEASQVFEILKIDATGKSLSAPSSVKPSLPARVVLPALVNVGGGARLFWSDNRSGKYAIHTRLLNSNGAPMSDDVAVTDGTKDAELASAVQIQNGYALGYASFEDASNAGLIVTDADGQPTGIEKVIAQSAQLPAVAWTGTQLGVLLGVTFEIYDLNLNKVVSFPFYPLVSQELRYPDLAWTPNRYFGVTQTNDPAVGSVVRSFGPLGCSAPN